MFHPHIEQDSQQSARPCAGPGHWDADKHAQPDGFVSGDLVRLGHQPFFIAGGKSRKQPGRFKPLEDWASQQQDERDRQQVSDNRNEKDRVPGHTERCTKWDRTAQLDQRHHRDDEEGDLPPSGR